MMPKHSDPNLVPLVDGLPVQGHAANAAILLLALFEMSQRITFGRRKSDGSYAPVPFEWDVSMLNLQNMGAGPETPRGLVAAVSSIVEGRERDRRQAREDRPPAPLTPSDAARQTGVDLVAQESAAIAALQRIRSARERHAQLVDAGDAVAAAELRP